MKSLPEKDNVPAGKYLCDYKKSAESEAGWNESHKQWTTDALH